MNWGPSELEAKAFYYNIMSQGGQTLFWIWEASGAQRALAAGVAPA